jgi:hypothetical protein
MSQLRGADRAVDRRRQQGRSNSIQSLLATAWLNGLDPVTLLREKLCSQPPQQQDRFAAAVSHPSLTSLRSLSEGRSLKR